jgi:uncharacterized delta-60 repeat protein
MHHQSSLSLEALESRQFLSAGDLDRSFASGGILLRDDLASAYSVAVQSDGKLFVAASVNSATTLFRLNPDGSPDSSFPTIQPGFGGKLFLQSDGKILLAGSASDGLAAARYNANGTPDTSFNGTGQILLHDHNSGGNVTLQPDGRIVFGYTRVIDFIAGTDVYNMAAKRINTNGTLDTSFGDNGEAHVDSQEGVPGPGVHDIFAKPDGTLVLVGVRAQKGGGGSPWYNTFGPDGRGGASTTILPDIPQPPDETERYYTEAVMRPDGQIAVAAYAHWPETGYFLTGSHCELVDYDRASGVTTYADAIANAGNNKTIVAGNEGRGIGVQRFNPDGTPDNSFGFAGSGTFVKLAPKGNQPFVSDVVVTPQGDSFVFGYAPSIANPTATRAFIAKYQGDSAPGSAPDQPPVAALIPPDLDPYVSIDPTIGSRRFRFRVLFSAEHPIDTATLDNYDVRVTGPNGFNIRAYFDGIDTNEPATAPGHLIAWYNLRAPGGHWGPEDAGKYTIFLRKHQVFDTAGQSANSIANLGAFRLFASTTASAASAMAPAIETTPFATRRRNDVL